MEPEQKYAVIVALIATIPICIALYLKRKELAPLSKEDREQYAIDSYKRLIKQSIVGGIFMFTIIAIFTGIMFFKYYKDDADYALRGETVYLNDAMKSGNIPETGTYVTVRFNLIGQEYFSDNGRLSYHPIVLLDSGEKPHVIALGESSTDPRVMDYTEYIRESTPFLEKGMDEGNSPTIEYSGRLSEISSTLNSYNTATADSKMSGDDYIFENLFINTTESQEDLKRNIYTMLKFFIVSIILDILCIIGIIFINTKLEK